MIFQELIKENELRKVYKPSEGSRHKGILDVLAEKCEKNCLLF